MIARLLLFADTHLGIDLAARPRIERRRRGDDFFANYERVLQAARDHSVHAVVHGGDLFYRSRIPASLVQAGFLPLKRLANDGIPVYVVPGNHERSAIPFRLLAEHPGIFLFDRARTFTSEWNGVRVALAGFPCERKDVRREFGVRLEATGWHQAGADVNLLCVHQCFEGATVGPQNFTFRSGEDVVPARLVPEPFAAVLAGHIHRHQVLTTDLRGRPLPTPVFYPGSIERTSFAERDEVKGYIVLEVAPGAIAGGEVLRWTFHSLPARPMVIAEVSGGGLDLSSMERFVEEAIARAPTDAVLQIRVRGQPLEGAFAALRVATLRARAPATMNIEVALPDIPRPGPVRLGQHRPGE